jgi:predicted RNA binding protein YcfA (HicA-like mRNA interferase family)
MQNRIKNWTYREIKKFLEFNSFVLINTRGSHHYFSGNVEGVPRMVTVPFHGNSSVLPRTMSSIISQSGIKKEAWFIF